MSPLLRPFALCVRYWPQLVACYLVGELAHYGAIQLAAWAGWDNQWWAAVIMPFAAISRLGSYAAMFLVLRSAIPALAELPRRSARRIDVFATIVLPFFAIYVAWQLYRQDWIEFSTAALGYRVDQAWISPGAPAFDPTAIPTSAVTWIVLGAALALRFLLSGLADRLPKWMVVIRVYVDALWVFLVLTFSLNNDIALLVRPGTWISERRIVVWFNVIRADLFSHVRPLEIAWHYLMSAVHVAFGAAAIPLMWLAVAGIVYGVTSAAGWRGALRRTAGHRATGLLEQAGPAHERIQGRWSRLPGTLREKVSDFVRRLLGRFEPILDSARVVLHGGVFALSLYVLAYVVLAWLDMQGSFYGIQTSSGYLLRFMAWLFGPHPEAFWNAYLSPLAYVSHLIIEPLRICLIASTFAYCLEHVARSQDEAHQDRPNTIDDVDRSGHSVAGQQESELQRAGFAALPGGTIGRGDNERADSLIVPPARPVGDEADAADEGRRPGPIDGDHE